MLSKDLRNLWLVLSMSKLVLSVNFHNYLYFDKMHHKINFFPAIQTKCNS